jgi:uncharacterized protein (TIGR02246 family)
MDEPLELDTGDADAEIRRLFDRLLRAWTDGDAVAYGKTFTEDVDYVPFDGTHTTGRRAVVESHDKLFRGVLDGSALVGEVESIRYVRPDVAIVHTLGSVLMPWRTKLPKRRLSRQTIVTVRDAEGWRFTAFHNGRVRPQRIPEPNSLPSRASRLVGRLSGRRNGNERRADGVGTGSGRRSRAATCRRAPPERSEVSWHTADRA